MLDSLLLVGGEVFSDLDCQKIRGVISYDVRVTQYFFPKFDIDLTFYSNSMIVLLYL